MACCCVDSRFKHELKYIGARVPMHARRNLTLRYDVFLLCVFGYSGYAYCTEVFCRAHPVDESSDRIPPSLPRPLLTTTHCLALRSIPSPPPCLPHNTSDKKKKPKKKPSPKPARPSKTYAEPVGAAGGATGAGVAPTQTAYHDGPAYDSSSSSSSSDGEGIMAKMGFG